MSELEALWERARASLEAARSLLRDGFPDFAASRAYYSMFYVAEALLLSEGKSYSRHSGVIAAIGRDFVATGRLEREYHQWLIAAQDFRNIGDYGLEHHVSEEQAEQVCEWASRFLEAGQRLLA